MIGWDPWIKKRVNYSNPGLYHNFKNSTYCSSSKGNALDMQLVFSFYYVHIRLSLDDKSPKSRVYFRLLRPFRASCLVIGYFLMFLKSCSFKPMFLPMRLDCQKGCPCLSIIRRLSVSEIVFCKSLWNTKWK